MTTPRPDPLIGTDLGSYRIEAVIGRGGMGVVYLATQASLGRKVALKVLAPDLVDEEAFRQRFVRESQMAAAIEHPNILPIYEAGEIEGTYFLAMRYVEGTDLEGRLRAGPLEPRETVQLLAQVASALDAAGEIGLVHRDVKPANVLIASGKGMERADHAYLTDFGLTKHRGSQTGLTQSGAFMGTLDYIAPEQVEGRQVDARTDQYSLACVAFHCLTGSAPFPRDTDIAIAMAHLHDVPPAASSRRSGLPAEADAVLARGMAKAPDDRFPSSETFISALRQALGVSPTGPHVMPSARPDRRPMVVIAVAAIGVIAVAVAVLWAAGGGPPPSASDDQVLGGSPATDDVGAPSDGSTGSPATSPSAPFTLLESRLVLSIPPESAPECVRGEDTLLQTRQGPSLKPRAHVRCQLLGGQGPDTMEGFLLPPSDLFGGYDVIRAIAAASEIGEGDCETAAQAFGGWTAGQDGPSGGYVCRPAPGGGAELTWSVDDARALYRAVQLQGDNAALYRWWIDNREQIIP